MGINKKDITKSEAVIELSELEAVSCDLDIDAYKQAREDGFNQSLARAKAILEMESIEEVE